MYFDSIWFSAVHQPSNCAIPLIFLVMHFYRFQMAGKVWAIGLREEMRYILVWIN